jgi:DNA mismatch repair ATPase MutS
MQVKNNGKVISCDIKFDKNNNTVVVTGANQSGKSSLLSAIYNVAKKNLDTITQDTDESVVKITIDDPDYGEFQIKKVQNRVKNTHHIEITPKPKIGAVAFLKALFNSVDIGRIANSSNLEMWKMLMEVFQVEELQENLEMNKEAINRLNAELKRIPEITGIEEVKKIDTKASLEEREKLNNELQHLEKKVDLHRQKSKEIGEITNRIDELNNQINSLLQEKELLQNEIDNDNYVTNIKNSHSINVDIEFIDETIRSATTQNERYQQWVEEQKSIKDKKDIENKIGDKKQILKDLEKEIKTNLQSKQIEGLIFHPSKKEVTDSRGIPWSQFSTSQKMVIACHLIPNISDSKILVIENGGNLGPEAQKSIANMAEKNGIQVFIEIPGPKLPGSLHIEEGEVQIPEEWKGVKK